MGVCKYFLQGNCRFGSNCRYEHSYATSGTSVFNRNKSSGQQYSSNYFTNSASQTRSHVATQESKEAVQAFLSELMLSEQGGQWPLSCFVPFKDRACFPGLEDHSPEELRWLMYESSKLGTLEECKRKISDLYEKHALQKKNLMNPNAEVCSLIVKLAKGQKIETTVSPFAQTSTSPSTFTSANGLFKNPPVSTSFTFALPDAGSGTSGFGMSNQTFGSSIVQPSAVSNVSIFCTPVQSNAPAASIFGGGSQKEVVSQNAFNNIHQNTLPSFHHGASFNNQSSGTFARGSVSNSNKGESVVASTIYTSLSELSEDEKSLFSSDTFTMGKVPTRPPAKELCC